MPVFLWLILLPVVAAPLVYLGGRVWWRRAGGAGRPPGQNRVAFWLALGGLATAWPPLLAAAQALRTAGPAAYQLGGVALRFDEVSLLLAVVTLTLTTLVVLFSGPYVAGDAGQEKYYAMVMAMAGVMIGLGCAADLFNLWLWFEAMAVTSYLLVLFHREQPASLEAGVKYLVQSATGSALALLGIALVLAETGTLDLQEIRTLSGGLAVAPALKAAGALFLIGFGVKAALVPLHTWLPDAHAQAPSGVSALLSGVVIEAGLVAMLRAFTALSGAAPSWGALLLGFGAANMLVGNLLALRQTQVKRLLAFSSVSHVGYMALGLGVAVYSGQAAGAQGGLFHLLTHGLMKGLAFLSAGALLFALRRDQRPLTTADLAGAATRYPLVALAFSLAVLGLGGLPPLAGFMSKWQIFAAGVASQNGLLVALVVFAALNSVLSLAYYAPLVNAVFRRRPSPAVRAGRDVPAAMTVPLLLLAGAVVAIGFWPSLARWLSDPAGSALVAALH